jgi:hypothetical protein
MNLSIKESDQRLSAICRAIEDAARLNDALPDVAIEIEVEVVPDFDDPVASGYNPALPPRVLAIFRDTPAGYRASLGKVRVNARTFFSYGPRMQAAILCHEIGHLVGHKTGKANWNDDLEADFMACQVGYKDEIFADRAKKHPDHVKKLAARLRIA